MVDGAEQTRPPGPARTPHRLRSGRRVRRQLPKRIDRWRWRRRIRSRPQLHLVYRVIVAAIGLTVILVAVSIGWLPGPGGIPLAIVGLAILASEFVWAHHLLGKANRAAHDLARWTASQPKAVRVGIGVGTAAVVLLGLWIILLIAGVPPWLPDWLGRIIAALPGVAPA